jgi:hypothetical protein
MIVDKLASYIRKIQGYYVRDLAKGLYLGLIRYLRIDAHRRRLIKEYGRSPLPLIRCDALLGPGPHRLSHYTFAPFGASPIEYALIQGLARRFRACHFLEIGSLRGETLANLNSVVDSATCITLSKEDLLKMGLPKPIADTNMLFASEVTNLRLINADSRSYDFSQLEPIFNLTFVDGDHFYESVKSDTKNVLSVCAKEFSIVWHDYTLADHTTINWEVFAGILDGLPREMWRRLYHVNNTACAVLLPEAWDVYRHEHVFYPERVYSLTMSSTELDRKISAPQV